MGQSTTKDDVELEHLEWGRNTHLGSAGIDTYSVTLALQSVRDAIASVKPEVIGESNSVLADYDGRLAFHLVDLQKNHLAGDARVAKEVRAFLENISYRFEGTDDQKKCDEFYAKPRTARMIQILSPRGKDVFGSLAEMTLADLCGHWCHLLTEEPIRSHAGSGRPQPVFVGFRDPRQGAGLGRRPERGGSPVRAGRSEGLWPDRLDAW